MRFGRLLKLIESREHLANFIEAIMQDRLDLMRYQVLADYLQEEGDPIGDLLRISTTPIPQENPTKVFRAHTKIENEIEEDFRSKNIHFSYSDVIHFGNFDIRYQDDHESNVIRFQYHQILVNDQPVRASDLPYELQRAVVYSLALGVFGIIRLQLTRRTQNEPEGEFDVLLWQQHLLESINTLYMILNRHHDNPQAIEKNVNPILDNIDVIMKQRNNRPIYMWPTYIQSILQFLSQHRVCDQIPDTCRRIRDTLQAIES